MANYIYLEVPPPFREEIIQYNKTFPKKQVESIELNPHITIKWGLETENVSEIANLIKNFKPIRVMFGKTNMFMADGYIDQDILKVDVFGMSLVRMNRVLSTLPSQDVYSIYNPHITLAHMKKYYALLYIGHNDWIGSKFVSDNVIFKTDKESYKIYCDGNYENLNV